MGERTQDTRLTDPIIAHPGGWGADIPQWLRNAVLIDRLLDGETGTDAEACAYLMTAALTAPLDSDWATIFFYVATQTLARYGRRVPDDDIRVETLSDYHLQMLSGLKRHIFERRQKLGRQYRKTG